MGLWGASQAIAFGLGGFAGTVLVDVGKGLMPAASPGSAYALVFGLEAIGFFVAHWLALGTAFVRPAVTVRLDPSEHGGAA
jgi:BCD family chlorophyll transporter-like MFS transporter